MGRASRVALFSAVSTALFVLCGGMAAAQSQCIGASQEGNGADLRNYCDQRINVVWYDDGYCTPGNGCAISIGPGGTSRVGSWNGTVSYAICWGYDYPTGFDGPYDVVYNCR